MQERAPRFPFRPPTPLPSWSILAGAFQIGILCVYHVLNELFGAQPLRVALSWGVLSTLLTLPLLAAAPLLKDMLGRGSLTRDWLLFISVYGALGLAASLLRSLVAPWALGIALPQNLLLGLVGSMAVTFLITIAGFEALSSRIQFQRDWEQRNLQLQHELAESRSRLVLADDTLRREAAEYLHGEVQSRLLMAWALLDQARDEPQRRLELAREAREQLGRLREEGVNHARFLMGIAERSLSERVADLAARFQAVMPIALEIAPEFREREKGLGSELLDAAHCMVEEGLLNAFRHAHAQHVVLLLDAGAEGLTLSVRDDGTGFEPQTHPRGLGLSGLGGRLAMLGGCWSLDSAPGRGTHLFLSLPVPSAVRVERA